MEYLILKDNKTAKPSNFDGADCLESLMQSKYFNFTQNARCKTKNSFLRWLFDKEILWHNTPGSRRDLVDSVLAY